MKFCGMRLASLCVCLLQAAWTPSLTALPSSNIPIGFPTGGAGPHSRFTPSSFSPDNGTQVEENFRSNANKLTNINDFVRFFDMEMPKQKLTISTRNRGGASIAPTELEQAVCQPELTSVPLDLPQKNGLYYFPYCVRVEQCGGCCILPHHSCQPTATEKILVQAVKVNNNVVSAPRRRRVRKAVPEYVSVEVERHLSCDCKCRLQPADCDSAIQTYNEYGCNCVCKDSAAEASCQQKSSHFWNSNSCKCLCRNAKSCSTGHEFSHENCSCSIPNFDYSLFP